MPSWYIPAFLPSGPNVLPLTFPATLFFSIWNGIPACIILSYSGCWLSLYPVLSTTSSTSGITQYYLSASEYSSNSCYSVLLEFMGNFMNDPQRISNNSSKTFCFFSSLLLFISSVQSGRAERCETTLPFPLSIYCDISLPTPTEGPRTLPNTKRWWGTRRQNHNNSTIHRTGIGIFLRNRLLHPSCRYAHLIHAVGTCLFLRSGY